MKIKDNLLQNANFRQNLEASFKSLEQYIEQGTLWNCGVTSKGIVIVSKNDRIIDKIVFLAKKLFGFIDTSYSSLQELKQKIKLAELTELTDKITAAQQKLGDIKQQGTVAAEDLRTKTDQVKDVTQELNLLNTGFKTKEGEISKLEEKIAAKKTEVELLNEKLKAIAQEEELEAKLQTQRVASQAIIKEIEEITEDLGKKHAALISRIGETELGLAGWITNATQIITQKEEALSSHLSKDEYGKSDNGFEVVLNNFRDKLHHLRNQIPLIINSKQYADFLGQLKIIETSGWSDVYYGQTYTVAPKSQSPLQKTILREIKELAELTFTRSQMMALTV